jgi:heptosyltransferase-1
MYKKKSFRSILIIKMSSLGDIIQAFHVLDYLQATFPDAVIDWVTEEAFVPLVSAHPYVRKALSINLKEIKKGWRHWLPWKKIFRFFFQLRKVPYDVLFDLQGNCKSGVVTFFSRACNKVGFGYHSVREKPNVLFTRSRFNVSKEMNIREQYLELVQKFFQKQSDLSSSQGVELAISFQEKAQIQQIFLHPSLQTEIKIMVCPGSQWMNKQIPLPTLSQFLRLIKDKLPVSFLFVWGSEEEKIYCEQLFTHFPETSFILEKLPVTVWQNVMNQVDVVVAVDSSALHLCGITKSFSFSVFGPTSPSVFKPIGSRHGFFQGACPYGKQFDKTCPLLRTCSTGACMGNLKAEEMCSAFFSWWTAHHPIGAFRGE